MRLAQNLQVTKINFVDLDSSGSSLAPAHFWIVDVIKRLLWPLKQDDWSPEPGGSEALRPVGLLPIGARRLRSDKILDLVFGDAFVRSESLGETQFLHFAQTLAVIRELPQPAILTVLQNPSVEDGEESHFVALRFQFEHDLFCDVRSVAQATQTIWTARLHRFDRRDVLIGESLHFFFGIWSLPTGNRGMLLVPVGSDHIPKKKCRLSPMSTSRRSNRCNLAVHIVWVACATERTSQNKSCSNWNRKATKWDSSPSSTLGFCSTVRIAGCGSSLITASVCAK